MNFKPQAYFIDLDGTMLDLPKKESKISEENIRVIQLVNKTTPVIISTGRANSEFVMSLTNKIHSPYVICQNGGIIIDKDNNILKKNEIQKDTVLEIIQILKDEKMFFIINSGDIIYGSDYRLKFVRPWAKKYKVLSYDNLPKLSNSTKIITFGKTKKGIIKLKEKLAHSFENISLHIVSKGYSIEINDCNATKGIADKFICDLLNIDSQKAVHIGDSGNDISSLNFLGTFVCMKNAPKNIKKYATILGPSYKKSGVAKILKKLENIL